MCISRPFMIRRVLAGLAFVLLLGSGCGQVKTPFYTVRPRDVAYRILSTFTVKDPAPLTMTAAGGGTVKTILVKEGDQVKAGQVLVQLDDFTERQNLRIAASELESTRLKMRNAGQETRPKLREQLAEQRIALDNARTDYDRSVKLLNQGAIAPVELEQARNKYQKALSDYNQTQLTLDAFSKSGVEAELRAQWQEKNARLALAQKAVADKCLAAPFAAVVSDIRVQLGQKLQPNEPVIVIIEDQVPTLELDIDQKELPFLATRLSAAVKFDARPDNPVAARVVYICTDINTEKGTCRVRLVLNQKQEFIKFGMTGTAEITAADFRQVLAVPAKYIERSPEGSFVWQWDGRQAVRQSVFPKSVGERWAIVGNLSAGAKILLPVGQAPPGRVKPGREEEFKP